MFSRLVLYCLHDEQVKLVPNGGSSGAKEPMNPTHTIMLHHVRRLMRKCLEDYAWTVRPPPSVLVLFRV